MVLPDATGKWALAALALLLPLAIVCKAIYASILLCLLGMDFHWSASSIFSTLASQYPCASAVYGGAVMLSPPLRQSVGWLRAGRLVATYAC